MGGLGELREVASVVPSGATAQNVVTDPATLPATNSAYLLPSLGSPAVAAPTLLLHPASPGRAQSPSSHTTLPLSAPARQPSPSPHGGIALQQPSQLNHGTALSQTPSGHVGAVARSTTTTTTCASDVGTTTAGAGATGPSVFSARSART